jgi:hypothetical protein
VGVDVLADNEGTNGVADFGSQEYGHSCAKQKFRKPLKHFGVA